MPGLTNIFGGDPDPQAQSADTMADTGSDTQDTGATPTDADDGQDASGSFVQAQDFDNA